MGDKHPQGPQVSLVLFARAPVPGQVKTRLAQALGDEAACALYRAFLEDSCALAASAGAINHRGASRFAISRRCLYGTGGTSEGALGELQELARRHGYALREQIADPDLGARMAAALATELEQGPVLLLGTDTPHLPPAYLQEAAALLQGGAAEVVLGPAADGGYWLVGAAVPCAELFAPGVRWGSAEVLPVTLGRLAALQQRGLRVRLLPFFYDLDTVEDLRWWDAQRRLEPGRALRTQRVMEEVFGRG